MELQNIADLPAFVNPVVDLPAVAQVRRAAASNHVVGTAPSVMLPQTRTLLEQLSLRDERLAAALQAWDGWTPANEEGRLAA